MRKILTLIAILFGVTLAATPARADIAVGAGISTLGYGIHASKEFTPFFALRANANFGNFELPDLGLVAGGLGGIEYDISASMSSYGLIVDFHPLGVSPIGDGIVISGGIYYNQNEFDLTASGTFDVGGTNVTATVLTNMSFDKKYAPYVAVGYDGTFHSILPISFFVTAGVLLQGSPSVTITESTGLIGVADLALEAAQIEDDASNYQYYPVIAVGVMIKF